MYAVEFETTIKDGIVQIPEEYKDIYNQQKAQVFIISGDKPKSKVFNPKEFFWCGKQLKRGDRCISTK